MVISWYVLYYSRSNAKMTRISGARNNIYRGFGKGNPKGPLLFFVGIIFLWCYPMYFLKVRSSSFLFIPESKHWNTAITEAFFILMFRTVHSLDVEFVKRCSLLFLLLERFNVVVVASFCEAWSGIFTKEYWKLRSNYTRGKAMCNVISMDAPSRWCFLFL